MTYAWLQVKAFFVAVYYEMLSYVCDFKDHHWKFNGGDMFCMRCHKYKRDL